jgi:hypothetical protein
VAWAIKALDKVRVSTMTKAGSLTGTPCGRWAKTGPI